MKVTTLDEKSIRDIGHAFGYYDYGQETGMTAAFSGQKATEEYICAYVRGMLRGGFLYTTSERGEGYIAYKLPKEKMGLKTMCPIAKGMLRNSSLKRLLRFAMAVKRGGASLQDRMDREKKPYIFVGLVCVREKYQGQGYMRKVMDIAPSGHAESSAGRSSGYCAGDAGAGGHMDVRDEPEQHEYRHRDLVHRGCGL